MTTEKLLDLATKARVHGDTKAIDALYRFAHDAHAALVTALHRTRSTSTDYAKELRKLTT